jgi:hypothetical protein
LNLNFLIFDLKPAFDPQLSFFSLSFSFCFLFIICAHKVDLQPFKGVKEHHEENKISDVNQSIVVKKMTVSGF